jgi:hypothetical protein
VFTFCTRELVDILAYFLNSLFIVRYFSVYLEIKSVEFIKNLKNSLCQSHYTNRTHIQNFKLRKDYIFY